jgi:hypothetical protein
MNPNILLENRDTTSLSLGPRGYKPSLVITREILSQFLQSSLKDSANLDIQLDNKSTRT